MVAHMRLVNYAVGVKKRQQVDANTVMIERRQWITHDDMKDEWRRIYRIHNLDPPATDREDRIKQVLVDNERLKDNLRRQKVMDQTPVRRAEHGS